MASFLVKTEDNVEILLRSDTTKAARSYVEYRFSPAYGYQACPQFTVKKISDIKAQEMSDSGTVVDWWK